MFKTIQRLLHQRAQKRKGSMIIEVLFVLSIFLFISGFIFVNLSDSQKTARITQAKNDLRVISTAAVGYSALAKDGSMPTTVSAAAFTLSADNSVDGQEHKFLKKDMSDPWGGSYTIDAANRTVTCAGNDKEKVSPIVSDF